MKNIIIILGILIVAAAGIYIYTQGDSTALDLNGGLVPSETVVVNTQLYIERSARLNSLALNTDVLDDPLFTSLRSYKEPLQEYSVGRVNPFAEPEIAPRP